MADKGKPAPKTKKTSKSTRYETKTDAIARKGKFCPKCGPGVFLAMHTNRESCGNCGYSEWKSTI
ncbi:MAG: 30S ribosomal protein S27ae [Candidatus Diapherotrites archaeon]|nr:30S ribosomal protein S27ae [Candidatus Diapherotrites archaeon]MDZ4256292.1 30S ribosomal protein S27ae [archaeon]